MGSLKGRAFWSRAVADVDTGMTQAEAARRHEVSASALGYWVRRLRREAPQLLPVRITGTSSPRRCSVVLDALRVEFDEGTAPAYVAAVVQALRTC